jgi:hypothetical protein
VYDISLFIPEGICFVAFVGFVACSYSMHTRIWKLMETKQTNTN